MKSLYSFLLLLSSFFLPVIAQAQLTADFTSNIVTGCAPILVQFSDLSTGNPTSWHWNLGNSTSSTLQHPSTTYFTPGTYTITLTVSNASGSNTKTVTGYITVVATPSVSFVADDTLTTCVPATIQFTNLSSLNTPGTGSYFWDFGDGSTSTLQQPSHTYSNTGTFSVTLSATNASGCTRSLTKQHYISVVPKPVPDFTAPVTSSCTAPLTVNFTNASIGGTSFFWDLGNGNTSTAVNPTAVYATPGAYDVTLVAMNGNCMDTLVMPAYISIGSPAASFTPSTTTACTGNPVSFTNTSLPGPGNSSWDFGDGNTAIGANASHTYTTPGTYTVSLIVDYNNCSDTTQQTITVIQGTQPQFTASLTASCAVPFTTQFTSNITSATSYLWNFGDGTTSTAATPTHTYTAFGNYTVSLTVVESNGCISTVTVPNYISVYQGMMTVSATPAGGCVPANITFNTSIQPAVPVTSYIWDFGDGTILAGGATMAHTYAATGTYTVSIQFTVGQGCTFTSTPLSVSVGTLPTAGFTGAPLTICPQGTVNFTNTSVAPPGTTYEWFFGDGGTSNAPDPSYSYNAEGLYSVTLVANNNGCHDTLTIPNMVTVDPPTANFSINYDCIDRNEVSFIDSSTGAASWHWEFGDGNTSTLQHPVHTYATTGIYPVTLTVTHMPSGCISTLQLYADLFEVDAVITANDTVICKGEEVQFNALLSPPAGSYYILAMHWYFGDGGSALFSSAQPTHTYTSNGVYTVTLVVTGIAACTDTFVLTDFITVTSPEADFTGTPLNGCAPLIVDFTDQSTAPGAPVNARAWDFGDGTSLTTGNQTTPSHTYMNNGIFPVRLTVTDTAGCKDSMLRVGYVEALKPLAEFDTPDTLLCPGGSATFNNTSVGGSLTYEWDFGDGGTSTAVNPTHTYAASGAYTVRLIAIDNNSCRDTLIRTGYITVSGMNLAFTPSTLLATCPPATISFTNTSSGIGNYLWDFGNGNTSSLSSPTTVYSTPGTYMVTLTGQSGPGCMDSVSETITILGPSGTFSYSPTNGCMPLTLSFTSTNTNTQSLIWDMDNGFTQATTGNTFTYTYTTPGVFVPRVLLSDGVSCIVPVMGADTVRVDQLIADFSYTPALPCQPGPIQFTDTALYFVNPVASWDWDFGDGNTSTAHNPAHTYAGSGTYTVTLIMGTSQNCYDTVVKTITIHTPPIVDAGVGQTVCQSLSNAIQLQATGAQTYVWAPAGGLSCTTCPDPVASPTVTTTYTVIGTAANGCTDTSDVTITVLPLPVISAATVPGICDGSSAQLTATGGTSYSWTPATGLSCTNCSNPVATPSATTTYTVTGTDANGCSDTVQTTVTVYPQPVLSVSGDTVLCVGDFSQLQVSGATTYSWTPATGLSCTSCDNPIATPTTTTTYMATGTNANNCTDTAQITITVNPLPPVSAGSNIAVCIGSTTQLQATGAQTYVWSPTTGLSCTTCPNPVASLTTNETYTVTGTDTNGCVQASQVTVAVNPLPVVTTSPDQTICLGDAAPLQASGAQTYSWSPAAGLSCTTCPNPSASPAVTTTYTVTGTDANGCQDSATVTVFINPLPDVVAIPDQAICSLDNVQLSVTGAVSYQWSPAAGLSCTACDDPIASPTQTTTYTVTGTGANGCTNTDEVTVSLYAQPPVFAGIDQTICHGQTIQLQATGAQTYFWAPATALTCTSCADPVAAPSVNTTYTVTGTDIHGCIDSASITITVIQMQPFVVGDGDTLCHGESVQLMVSGGDQYLWLPSTGLDNNTIGNPTASPDVTTTYTVIIRQGDCFSDTGYITVFVYPMPTVNAGTDQAVFAGNSAQLFANSTHTTRYLWTPADGLNCTDCQNPVATPGQTTTYTVAVSNNFGCQAEDDVTVSVKCDNSTLYFANTFTPNGDGNNDRFYPQGKGLSEVTRFRIYNRWGEVVFDAQHIALNNEMQGWDGTYKGQPLSPDVFVYIADAICTTGEPMQLKGDISLIR